MTKVCIFGEPEKKRPITLSYVLENDRTWSPATLQPSYFKKATLIQKKYGFGTFDLILAEDPNGLQMLYLGNWNDGVVE